MINPDIIEALEELGTDNTVPKNVKLKLTGIVDVLKNTTEDRSIRINKALNLLDEVSDDHNIQSYSRTQIWNLVSLLEMEQNK